MAEQNLTTFDLTGELLDGRYRVEKKLGAGGMGAVFVARDERVGRAVVVKVPHPAMLIQDGFLERFEREIKSLTKLDHPHIVKVHDVGRVRGVPYAVLQFLPGGSLKERLTRGGANDRAAVPMNAADVAAWLAPVAEALDFVHEQKVIHRDVKPGNVLFDARGHVFLADFGIAKALGAEDTGLTRGGASPGSPAYMAPEAGTADSLGPAYDQYSLAVVVYEALSGKLPHEGATTLVIMMKKNNEPPCPLCDLAPQVAPEVAAVVMQALAKAPDDRFATCSEFAEAFRAAVAGQRHAALDRPRRAPTNASADAAPVANALQRRQDATLTGVTTRLVEPNHAPDEDAAAAEKAARASVPASVPALPPTRRRTGVLVGVLLIVACALGVVLKQWSGRDSGNAPLEHPAHPADASGLNPEAHPAAPPTDAPGTASAARVSATIESPKEGNATNATEITVRGHVEPRGATVKIAVADLPPKSFVSSEEGALTAKVPLPTKEGTCRIEVTNEAGDVLRQLDVLIDRSVAVNHEPVFDAQDPIDRDVVDHVDVQLDFGEAVTLVRLDADGGAPLEDARALEYETGRGIAEFTLPTYSGASTADSQRVVLGFRVTDRAGNHRDFTKQVEIFSGEAARAAAAAAAVASSLQRVAKWADVIRADPDPKEIPDGGVRQRIQATGLPWLVKERVSGMEMLLVPPGKFEMGSNDGGPDEKRVLHTVKITQPFYAGRYLVTQGEYEKVTGNSPAYFNFKGDSRLPVEQVSYDNVTASNGFLQKTGLRLLTEAEWEYVAHGLHPTKYPWGDMIDSTFANYDASLEHGTHLNKTTPVGSYPKGISWCGAYDMAGNVWQWCSDFYDANWYAEYVRQGSPPDPIGPASGSSRVQRGGGFLSYAFDVRCAVRSGSVPAYRYYFFGFRCARTP